MLDWITQPSFKKLQNVFYNLCFHVSKDVIGLFEFSCTLIGSAICLIRD